MFDDQIAQQCTIGRLQPSDDLILEQLQIAADMTGQRSEDSRPWLRGYQDADD